jgi:hypothetical protein
VTAAGDEVIESVEAAQHGRLATAGRTDEGCNLVFRQSHRDGMERLVLAIKDTVVAHLDEIVLDQRFRWLQRDIAWDVKRGIKLRGGKFQIHLRP